MDDGDGRGKLTLLQLELLDTSLIGGDGGTLDTDLVLLDGLGGVNGDLVVGLVTVLETEIIVLQVDIEVGIDELVLDGLPDDTGHLIAIELNDGVLDLDLGDSGSHGADGEGGDGLDGSEADGTGKGSTAQRRRQERPRSSEGDGGHDGREEERTRDEN